MGRYTGPVCRLCRREGVKLYLKGDRCVTAKCAFSKRKKAPGNAKPKKGKTSYYGMQLREKQKVKRFYVVNETQFRKYFDVASSTKENTGAALLQFLERRLDNIVYRAGFAVSRKQGREIVCHGHILVNNKKASISSMLLKKGDIIKIKDGLKESPLYQMNLKRETKLPNWLERVDDYTAKVMDYPTREEINDIPIKEQMIIELYSK
jgi:small subunit ribosomal protein S4